MFCGFWPNLSELEIWVRTELHSINDHRCLTSRFHTSLLFRYCLFICVIGVQLLLGMKFDPCRYQRRMQIPMKAFSRHCPSAWQWAEDGDSLRNHLSTIVPVWEFHQALWFLFRVDAGRISSGPQTLNLEVTTLGILIFARLMNKSEIQIRWSSLPGKIFLSRWVVGQCIDGIWSPVLIDFITSLTLKMYLLRANLCFEGFLPRSGGGLRFRDAEFSPVLLIHGLVVKVSTAYLAYPLLCYCLGNRDCS